MSNDKFYGLWPKKPYLSAYLQNLYANMICKYAGKRILELGCGTGWLCERVSSQNKLYTGVDLDTTAVKLAEVYGRNVHHQDMFDTIEHMVNNGYRTDTIVTCAVLQYHGDRLIEFLRECEKVADKIIMIERFTDEHHDEGVMKKKLSDLKEFNIIHSEKVDVNFIRYLIHRWDISDRIIWFEKYLRKLQIFNSWYRLVVIECRR